MCNKFRSRLAVDALLEAFPDLRTPGGLPNLEPREEINIGDRAPVIRRSEAGPPELATLRWGWPGPTGRPVYNFRSEGRRFASNRCLIPADGFYEFTDPEPPAPRRARKVRWLFTQADRPWFCIAGLIRPASAAGEDAWTMLTTSPGPDIAPYHDRQVVVLGPEQARSWLEDDEPERWLRPSLAGALTVERVAG